MCTVRGCFTKGYMQMTITTTLGPQTTHHMELADRYSAHNYAPLPVVVKKGEGCWIEDADGNRCLDMLSAYSALNFGHAHPEIVDIFVNQAKNLTLTSRAFQNDQFGPFCKEITELCGQDMVLPMNTGAEAVETALKCARKWGYTVKGVERDKAEVIVFDHNFHGRTISVISFSTEGQYKDDFGPLTPGFVSVAYGDASAVEAAINKNTVAVLMEPIQGEGGINVPPAGYQMQVSEICTKNNVLFIADEIQTGLGRTGKLFCVDHDGVKPDMLILGKALGGGMMPVSAVLGSKEVLGVFNPGDHGSTFGGNPLGCAVARKAIEILIRDNLAERAHTIGEKFMAQIRAIDSPIVKEVRGKGLLIGIELVAEAGGAKKFGYQLMEAGLLCKETSDNVLRMAPPLTISEADLDWALEKLDAVLNP